MIHHTYIIHHTGYHTIQYVVSQKFSVSVFRVVFLCTVIKMYDVKCKNVCSVFEFRFRVQSTVPGTG